MAKEPKLVSVGVDLESDQGGLVLWIDRGLKSGKLDRVPLTDADLLNLMTEGSKYLSRRVPALVRAATRIRRKPYWPIWSERDNGREPTTVYVPERNILGRADEEADRA